jgi:hypothetical protein
MPGREGFDKRSGFVKRSPDMLQRFIDPVAVAAEIERVCSLSRQVTTAETELGRAAPSIFMEALPRSIAADKKAEVPHCAPPARKRA